MPNWCDCELTIQGPREQVDAAVTRMEKKDLNDFDDEAFEDDGVFDFNRLIPYPERFKGPGSPALRREWKRRHGREGYDGYNMGGYEWCCANWGTKWPASDVERTDQPSRAKGQRKVHYAFQTAWSPPLPVAAKLSEEYPELKVTLRYWEGGNGFKGVSQFRGGECVRETNSSYSGSRGG